MGRKSKKKEAVPVRTWPEEILEQFADKWLVKTEPKVYIRLLPIEEFNKVRKGTKLLDRFGKEVKKGIDTESVEESLWIFGRMPYGFEVKIKEPKKKK